MSRLAISTRKALSPSYLHHASKACLRALATIYDASKKEKVVVVGGVAGGATLAARASRLSNLLDITVVERSPDVSFANCGLPYYLGREIVDRNKLALQTPQSLSSSLHITVQTETEAVKINREGKSITVLDLKTNHTRNIAYDKLVLAPGASPLRPKVAGIEDRRVLTLRNLQDMDKIDSYLKQPKCRRVAVIGAGFIGLEVVEQLHKLQKEVHLIEKSATVLPQADPEMSSLLHPALLEHGVHLHLSDGLQGFEPQSDSITVRLESGRALEADLVVLCIGVQPDSYLAKEAGLKTNNRGYIVVNDYMQTSDSSIYAVGDAVETRDLVFPDRRATVALGNIANMQARIAADHAVLQHSTPYKGSLGTSIVRAFDQVLALTGWSEKRLKAANIPYSTTTVTAPNHASYYPNALPITLKITFDPQSGKIYGGQAVGIDGADKRIDVVATAITGGLTIEDLSLTQLCYSPPFGSARDVVNIAGLAARNVHEKLVFPVYKHDDKAVSDKQQVQLVDVRHPDVAKLSPIPNSINIPYDTMHSKAKELDPGVEYRTMCALGKTAYFASRELIKAGRTTSTLIGGLKVHSELHKPSSISKPASKAIEEKRNAAATNAVVTLDCSGMSCPGPLLKLKEALQTLPPATTLSIIATDPGFKADVQAFADSNGLTVTSLGSAKGVITASLVKEEQSSTSSDSIGTQSQNKLDTRKGATIVVFSQDMDKVLASLIIANGALAMGGEVTLFFTFWGLNALRDPQRSPAKPKTLIDKAFGWMMPKGVDALPISNMNFLGAGTGLLKHVMREKNLPLITSMLQQTKHQKIRLVACTMSMEAMGIQQEELIDGVEFGGVAEYLGAASKTGTNLFI